MLSSQYYTATLTKDGNIVPVIGSEGVYTFTITGKNGYTGTYTKVIRVYGAVPYVGADGSTQSASSYLPVTSETTQMSYLNLVNRGWYVVFGDVMIDSTVTVTGEINLILCDGAFLNAEEGINIESSASLTVWVQSAGDGRLQVASDHAIRAYGDLTINGGIIYADSLDGPAIGGGTSNITINGGDVTARANGNGGAGISARGTLTINGGTVTAYGDYGGAGIGGGWAEGAGTITINGGIINAYGGNMSGSGIGSGRGGSGGSITINGGRIRAYGGEPEDIPTARRYDIGADRGDAIITFDYTDESADTMSVTAGVYAGTVKLLRTFYDAETLTRYSVTNNQDTSAIGGKTLIPAARVCTVSFQSGLGSGTMPSVLKVKGDEYELPESTFTPPSPTRPFVAWIVHVAGSDSVLMQPGDVVTLTDSARITAKYLSEYSSLQTLIDNAESGATIVLDQDYVSDSEEDTSFVIPSGKMLTIDLNGYTIDRALGESDARTDGSVFNVKGMLTVTDSSDGKTGTVRGGNKNGSGGAFYVPAGGTLIIEHANITNNRAVNGGAVYTNGTVIINGGSITNNTASNSGGGVFVNNNGTLVLAGGSITGNTAAANYHGGGIHTSGTMYVSGAPVVRNNTRGGSENNVGLYEGAVISVGGALSPDAYIGVNKSKANSAESETGVVTSGLDGNGSAWVFKADDEGQSVLPYEGEASLYPSDVYYVTIVIQGNGTVTADQIYAHQGDRIGFASEAGTGYRERSFTAEDDAGNDVSVSFGTVKNWIYMPASNITVTVVYDPYYLISVDHDIPHGTVDLDWVWAYAGESVPLSATPDKNYLLSEWVVTDADGNSVEISDGGFIMPSSNVTVSARFEEIPNPEGPVAYVDANGNDMTPVTAYTVIDPNTTIDSTGWYVVKENVGVGRQLMSGDVNLILCDGVTLTVNYGIFISDGGSLTIWQQSGGTGGMRVENITIGEEPAINGPGNVTMTVNGGVIYAEGYAGGDHFDDPTGGPGIFVKTLIVNAGSVTAVGGWHAAGIGGGEEQSGATVIINGGYVKSTGGLDGAGIGGGSGGHGGTVIINGGTVDAVSGGGSAGIGGGYGGSGGTVTINGGTVLAAGYSCGAGIGGGNGGAGGTIVINGGNVTANSYYTNNRPSSGIGPGGGSDDAAVTLSWTALTDSIYANSYGGTVTLAKPFTDGTEIYAAGSADADALADKTLAPYRAKEDLNADGAVTIADVTTLLDHLATATAYDGYYDLDENGSVTISDVTYLLDYLSTH